MPSITLDRPLFYRELADGCYSPVVYYLAKSNPNPSPKPKPKPNPTPNPTPNQVYYLAKFVEEAVLASVTSLL